MRRLDAVGAHRPVRDRVGAQAQPDVLDDPGPAVGAPGRVVEVRGVVGGVVDAVGVVVQAEQQGLVGLLDHALGQESAADGVASRLAGACHDPGAY